MKDWTRDDACGIRQCIGQTKGAAEERERKEQEAELAARLAQLKEGVKFAALKKDGGVQGLYEKLQGRKGERAVSVARSVWCGGLGQLADPSIRSPYRRPHTHTHAGKVVGALLSEMRKVLGIEEEEEEETAAPADEEAEEGSEEHDDSDEEHEEEEEWQESEDGAAPEAAAAVAAEKEEELDPELVALLARVEDGVGEALEEATAARSAFHAAQSAEREAGRKVEELEALEKEVRRRCACMGMHARCDVAVVGCGFPVRGCWGTQKIMASPPLPCLATIACRTLATRTSSRRSRASASPSAWPSTPTSSAPTRSAPHSHHPHTATIQLPPTHGHHSAPPSPQTNQPSGGLPEGGQQQRRHQPREVGRAGARARLGRRPHAPLLRLQVPRRAAVLEGPPPLADRRRGLRHGGRGAGRGRALHVRVRHGLPDARSVCFYDAGGG